MLGHPTSGPGLVTETTGSDAQPGDEVIRDHKTKMLIPNVSRKASSVSGRNAHIASRGRAVKLI